MRNRFIAQCHLDGTLPIPPLRAPLISLPGNRARPNDGDEEEDDNDDGTGHRRRTAAAAASKKTTPQKLNVIPFNEQAQHALAEFMHVTGKVEEEEEEEGGAEDEEELRALLARLKTT
jgi:hypothetical protein